MGSARGSLCSCPFGIFANLAPDYPQVADMAVQLINKRKKPDTSQGF